MPAPIEPSSGGSRSRVDARRQLGRHRLERGRARLVGCPEPFRDQTREDRQRSPCARGELGRRHCRRRRRPRHPAGRHTKRSRADICRRPHRRTELVGIQLRWEDRRVDGGLDGTVTLWDVRSATIRETLRGHSASASQPEFSPDGDALHDEPRRNGDRLAHRGRPRARAAVRVHARPGGPGLSAPRCLRPRRTADRRRPQGTRDCGPRRRDAGPSRRDHAEDRR